jgi:SAM-dependent methyltransferase
MTARTPVSDGHEPARALRLGAGDAVTAPAPPNEGYRERLFERYLSAIYGHLRNDLSAAGLERGARRYTLEFGAHLPADRDAPILEIGCGSGGFLRGCRALGYTRVQGIDVSPEQVRFCHDNGLPEVACADGLGFLRAHPERWAVVAMSDVLEHLPKREAVALLLTIHERLLPGGRVLIRVPNLSNPLNLRTRYVDLTHETGFTAESLARLLAATGFAVEAVHGALDRHRSLLGRWLFDRLLWRAFLVLYREVLWLDDPALPGKNLIAVGRRAEAGAERAA